MIYILTIALFISGVMLNVMEKVRGLRDKFPQLEFGDVWKTFFKQEWDSLMVSAIVLGTCQVMIFVSRTNHWKYPLWLEGWGIYLMAIVLGYAGQRLAYKYLKTSEGVLEKKIENLNSQP
jgi:hypothetical protein